ncbi:YbjN domain-containing protein [Microseira wollei]|uniref:YbjN domain-containing protein n=1 Tax=Microseira wollei NIES-4236 TaxID=2530354 RepID=A0AAV3XQY5_9CYAN|nr:YbjN domain-containing protein [Microseira wollei]GET42715.1 hypothetical protein MiSe_75330 [Microseira wollei NIES-4236]
MLLKLTHVVMVIIGKRPPNFYKKYLKKMEIKTEHSPLNNLLTLWHRTSFPLKVLLVDLALIKLDNEVIECHLTLLVNSETYQRIDTEALFNLKPEVRSPLTGGNFLPSQDIEIEISLQPNLLPQEIEQALNAAEAANYILNLSGDKSEPLLFEDNWLALSVRQQQPSGEIGYRTMWANITPSAFAPAATSTLSEQIFQATVNFANQWTNSNFSSSQDNITQAVELLTQTLGQVSENIASTTQKTFLDARAPQSNTQQILEDTISSPVQDSTRDGLIFAAMLNFFKQDNWPFIQIEGETALETAFTGKNGSWDCYAQAIEEEHLFIFYSICPVLAPESKRLAITELIAKANFNILVGNFDIDATDGEIRYKTSIDIEGDRISFNLLKNVVYTNVMMMDRYLPEIVSIIDGSVEQEQAIAAIESPPENLPPSDLNSESTSVTLRLSDRSIQPSSQIDNSVNISPELQANQDSESPKHIGELLYLLTPEELAEFDKFIQMKRGNQPFVARTILRKLEKQILAKLNADGAPVFAVVKTFFEQNKTAFKTAKLMGRYWGLFELSRQLIEQSKTNNNSSNPSIKEVKATVLVVEKISDNIKATIEQLATSYVDAKLDIECLIEIEQIREELAYCQEKLKNHL